MRMPNRLVAIASLLAVTFALAAAGCGKSVEGETKSWNANKLALEAYSGKYPGLKAAIAQHVASAQKAFDAAQSASDEDKQAKAMSIANEQLLLALRPLRQLDTAIQNVETLKKDRGILALSAGEVTPAIQLADNAVEKARGMLGGQGIDTGAAMVGKVQEALRVVKTGASNLAHLKDKVAAAAKAASATKPAAAPAAKPAAAPAAKPAVAPAAKPAPSTP